MFFLIAREQVFVLEHKWLDNIKKLLFLEYYIKQIEEFIEKGLRLDFGRIHVFWII